MTVEPIIAALALPNDSRVDQRVPKKLMLEQGAPTPADKRAIQDGIEEIIWVAALKPVNVGVPVFRDDVREYLEIAVLTLTLRQDAKANRLAELVHRAIPYPVLLVTVQAEGCMLSVAHKRWSQGETGKVVIEDMHGTIGLHADEPNAEETAFLGSLTIAGLPRGDLYALYQGWVDRIAALEAARITGVFALPSVLGQGGEIREGLEEHKAIERELVLLRARAKKEKQINRRVELNLEIKRLEGKMAAIAGALRGSGL
jgi:hypothetical protein